jgi:hypothetical protein
MIKKKNYTVGVIGMRGNPGEEVILLYHHLDPIKFDWIENVIISATSITSFSNTGIPCTPVSNTSGSSIDIVNNNRETFTDTISIDIDVCVVHDDVFNGGTISFTVSTNIIANEDDYEK